MKTEALVLSRSAVHRATCSEQPRCSYVIVYVIPMLCLIVYCIWPYLKIYCFTYILEITVYPGWTYGYIGQHFFSACSVARRYRSVKTGHVGSPKSVRFTADSGLHERNVSRRARIRRPKNVRFIVDSGLKVSGLTRHTCTLLYWGGCASTT